MTISQLGLNGFGSTESQFEGSHLGEFSQMRNGTLKSIELNAPMFVRENRKIKITYLPQVSISRDHKTKLFVFDVRTLRLAQPAIFKEFDISRIEWKLEDERTFILKCS